MEDIKEWMNSNLMTISQIVAQYHVPRATLCYRMKLLGIEPFITYDRVNLYLVDDLKRLMLSKE